MLATKMRAVVAAYCLAVIGEWHAFLELCVQCLALVSIGYGNREYIYSDDSVVASTYMKCFAFIWN